MVVIEVEVNEGPVIKTKRFLGRPLLRCEVSDDGRVRSFHVHQTAKGQYAVHICSYPTGKRLSSSDKDARVTDPAESITMHCGSIPTSPAWRARYPTRRQLPSSPH